MFFLIRTAARSGGQRNRAPQKPAGPPMTGAAKVFLVAFLLAGAGLTALFKHAGVSNGPAFLMSFGVLVLVLWLLAAIIGGGRSNGRKVTADEVRAAYAEQPSLPAEMEAPAREAEAWKTAHPEAFGDAR